MCVFWGLLLFLYFIIFNLIDMKKEYQLYFLNDYPPTEILEKPFYLDCIKRLSFSYRTIGDDNLIAYIALKNDSVQINIPNTDNARGCRIIGFWVKPLNCNGYVVMNRSILDNLFQDACFYIKGWEDENGNKSFDYIWFDKKDFQQSADLIEYLNTQNNDIIIIKLNE